VGDYTRQLGAELERQGHELLLIALNDRWQNRPEITQPHCLRLDPSLLPRRRAERARAALLGFRPDWVSLQYVCYAYHPRGLAWQWNPVFAQLSAYARRRHLMLHELWSGEGGHPPLRHRIIGLGQRWCVHHLHRHFQPDLVTTSIPLFQRRLSRRGIASMLLPLFGNIRVAPRDDPRVAGLLRAAGSQVVYGPRATFLNGIFFGTIHPDFDPEPLIAWLAQLQRHTGRRVILSLIGRVGPAAMTMARRLTSSLPDWLEVVSLDEQPETIISQALQFADFGINTGTAEYLGKSGTFAAMREHGLPVMVPDGALDQSLLEDGFPPIRHFSDPGSVTALLRPSDALGQQAGVVRTTALLLRLFAAASVGGHPQAASARFSCP
jgi:hypothetical protein